ncbi:ABC transporter related protein [Caldalkalibacillus thermarum TA2.A1]|uniref:Energy-coupling factor transporter ATP-binding protein EcfA2 n=1 Tax=Caldalkalibacillus thermarum (strain TA2.A1) TaxID=986075 RepID=F5L9J7_CALTT|nr:energy-coupling factor transporter ATPase [Caldalkalibacillus thermarum]EGL81984.1 ABC transporter related protein [Caldalkalibacillus thermarum TA2.A1]QZT34451.1 energy-coupling factor transporter ATPase [Caldalkalibacillus thermarum TA2.A1]
MEIITKDLGYIYHPRTPFAKRVLTDVNIRIKANRLVAVVGQTGSGKSTLIQHFNGLLKPSEGYVQVGPHKLEAGQKKIPILHESVGLVFQYPEHQLFAETVEKDIAFGPKNLGWPEELINLRVRQVLDKIGLAPSYLSRSPFELSGGEKRRVAIAGVLVMQPDILILDEPTAGLDPEGQQQILEMMVRWKQERGKTVILVTHQMDHVAEYADEVVVMEAGRVKWQTTPLALFTQYTEQLRQLGLEIPSLIELVQELNQRLKEPIPLTSTKKETILSTIARYVKGARVEV